MSIYKIDNGISIPARGGPGGGNKYPYRELEIGQSFFVAGGPERSSDAYKARQRLSYRGASLKRKFISRVTTEDGIIGVRIWRVQ